MQANQNLYSALRHGFARELDAVAIETTDDAPLAYTWRDLDAGSAMIANLLGSLDLPAGTRVAVQTGKSVEALMLYLAVLRAGFVYLPLNPAYQSGEIEYFIGDAEPGVVVCSQKNFGWVSPIAFKGGTAHVYTLDPDRTGSLLQRAALHSREQAPVQRTGDDLAAIIYTSGTTGRSKGAMLSHANLLCNAQTLQRYWGWRSAKDGGDVLIHALPIFHLHGLFVAIHGALINGSKMIWLNHFDAQTVVARLPEATVFMGVPTLYVRLLAVPALTAEVCRNMRLFVSGSAPLLIETFNAFRERTGHTILERYGMSETAMLTSNPYYLVEGERRGGTVGFALPDVSVRIVDDNGEACPADTIGNLQVAGPSVFEGYWRMPDKTRTEFAIDPAGTRWFKTGDVGKIDARGYVTIVGRSKDLIISGGFNVYPAEVESVLNELPGVAESAVVGVPHADFGEGVIAVVVARAGTAPDPLELIAQLKARIAHYKVPKRVFVAAELPRNAMGKVQKNRLRDEHRLVFGA